MAHWAEIDETNTVIRVLVGDNDDPAGDEGYSWLIENLGGTWLKTSYNAESNGFRKHFAGIGYKYDESLDAFISPPCHLDAVLDEESCTWVCGNDEHSIV